MLTSLQEQTLCQIVSNALDVAFPAAQIEVLVEGVSIFSRAFGYLDSQTRKQQAQADTRFDLASLSMIFTTAAFMTLVDDGMVGIDQPVRDVLSEFSGLRKIAAQPRRDSPGELIEFYPHGTDLVNTRKVTFQHLLAHTSGLPAWLPLHLVEAEMRAAGKSATHIDYTLRDMATGTQFAYPPDSRVVFSDVGYLILGFAIERLGRKPLRQVMRERVVDPLGMLSVCYGSLPCDDVAPTEYDESRGRRLCGEAHDQNVVSMGGVGGHSGLFAHARDVARLGEMFRTGGAPLLNARTVADMTRQQSSEDSVRRGLGFALHSDNELASSFPFSDRAYGHLGFTGTSLWVDPNRALVVACLTNHAYFGNKNDDAMNTFRSTLHRALAAMIPER